MTDDDQAEGLEEGILLEEFGDGGGSEAGDAPDGLEMDASQADEIKDIFWATLPQYLDPVEEMLGQIFSADALDDKLRTALVSTLASIRMAAGRIGVDEAVGALEAMAFHLEEMDDDPESMARVRDAVTAQLAGLRERCGGEGEGGGEQAGTRTLFAALRDADGIDEAMLERFTSAGLVTVEQMEVASPDEIAAVSGLDMETVHRVLALLGIERRSRPRRESELEQALRAQVEAEMAVEELRTELQRRRASIEGGRQALAAAQSELESIRTALEAARRAALEGVAELDELRRERDEVHRRITALATENDALEGELRRLREHEARVVQQESAAQEDLDAIQDRVQQMIRSVYWK